VDVNYKRYRYKLIEELKSLDRISYGESIVYLIREFGLDSTGANVMIDKMIDDNNELIYKNNIFTLNQEKSVNRDINQQLMNKEWLKLENIFHTKKISRATLYDNFTPREAEFLIGSIFLNVDKFKSVEVKQQSRDGGVDVVCRNPISNFATDKLSTGIQIKWNAEGNSTGRDDLQSFWGSIDMNYQHGIFVTLSTFTKGAYEYCKTKGGSMSLVNGAELCQGLNEYFRLNKIL